MATSTVPATGFQSSLSLENPPEVDADVKRISFLYDHPDILQAILEEIGSDWEVFCFNLGVSTSKLKSIKLGNQFGGTDAWFTSGLQLFLSGKGSKEISMTTLRNALKQINHTVLETRLNGKIDEKMRCHNAMEAPTDTPKQFPTEQQAWHAQLAASELRSKNNELTEKLIQSEQVALQAVNGQQELRKKVALLEGQIETLKQQLDHASRTNQALSYRLQQRDKGDEHTPMDATNTQPSPATEISHYPQQNPIMMSSIHEGILMIATKEFVTSWFEIGTYLKIPNRQLKIIKANNPNDVSTQNINMLTAIRQSLPDATLQDFIKAIDHVVSTANAKAAEEFILKSLASK